jgi:hypothetical protein
VIKRAILSVSLFTFKREYSEDHVIGDRICAPIFLHPQFFPHIHIGWGGMYWIDLTQDRGQWKALVNKVMNLQVP